MGVNITSEQVKAFWEYMAVKYDFKIVSKDDSEAMKIIAWSLDQMHVLSRKKFLERYTTTICLGEWRAVYVPFEIGSDERSFISQAITCVHEAQHVVQADREIEQPMRYLVSDTSRAFYEADALRTNMEMYWFFTGELLSARKLTDGLKNYSIKAGDRRIAKKHLIIASKTIQHGGVITGTSKTAIKWWRRQLATGTLYKPDQNFPVIRPIGVNEKKKKGVAALERQSE